MMQMAREFKDAPQAIEAMGWTTARELVNAPQAVMNRVYDILEEGKEVTAKDVQQMKAEAKSSQHDGADSDESIKPIDGELIPADRMESNDKGKQKPKVKVVTEDEIAQEIRMEGSPTDRVYRFKEHGKSTITLAWAVLGLLAPNADEEYSGHIIDFAVEHTMDGLNQGEADHFDRHIAPLLDLD